MRVFKLWRTDDRWVGLTEKLQGLERTMADLQATVAALASEEGGRARASHERGEHLGRIITDTHDILTRMSAEVMSPTVWPDNTPLGEASESKLPPVSEQRDTAPRQMYEIEEREANSLQRLHKRQPLGHVDGIPIFAPLSRGVETCTRAKADHDETAKPGGAEPCSFDVGWSAIEKSTTALIQKFCRDGQIVLDVGFGRGNVLEAFDRLKRHGVDISLARLRVARDSGIQVAFAHSEDLPYKDCIFDAVICAELPVQMSDLNRCCSELLRVLRPGGILILCAPLEKSLEPYRREPSRCDFAYLCRRSLAGLKSLLTTEFECQFVESLPSEYDLASASQSRFAGLAQEAVVRLADVIPRNGWEEHAGTAQSMALDDEDVASWLRELKDRNLGLYEAVAAELAYLLKIDVVVQKSYGGSKDRPRSRQPT